MSIAKHTQAVVAWNMWKARQRRNALLHAEAVQRYTGIINATRPTLTVLNVSERYIDLQCNACGARLAYSTRQVKRLSSDASPNSVVCKACAVRPNPPDRKRTTDRSSPTRTYLCSTFRVVGGDLVYNNHSKQYDGKPFGTVKWLNKARRERRYGYLKGYGYYYADELIHIMEHQDAQEEASRS